MPNGLPVTCALEAGEKGKEREGRIERQSHSHTCPGIEICGAHARKREFSAIARRISSKEFTSSILSLVIDWPQSRELGQSCFWCLDTTLALFLPHPFRSLCTHGFSIA